MRDYLFYQWSTLDVAKHFGVDPTIGLSSAKVSFRLQKYGQNTLSQVRKDTALQILLRQFTSFFVLLLILAAVISYFIDGLFESIVLVIIIFANVLLGFLQEYKAEKALDELRDSFRAKCKVIREGRLTEIESSDLVIGDIVGIEQGDHVPADLRLIVAESLRIDESSLTGE